MQNGRSISIGGSVAGAYVVAGDGNRIEGNTAQASVGNQSADLEKTLAALRSLLLELNSADKPAIEQALDEASQEAARENPDRDKIGTALTRAIDYASKAGDFAEKARVVMPHLIAMGSWLGTAGHGLLKAIGAPV
jgi:ABC-type transporter Mla subunit MlaD